MPLNEVRAMDEKKITVIKKEKEQKEYITGQEAIKIKGLFKKYLKSYKEKNAFISDQEWLEQLFQNELPELSSEEVKQEAKEIIQGITTFEDNLKSITESAKNGVSKEYWLSDKLQEAAIGMAINEYGKTLHSMDAILYQKNMELAEALQRSSDGHIKMSPNLDGNIAEHLIAKTTELSGFLQGKNVKVEVRDVFTSNSVDVRAINMDTGKYQNYQLKFGKNAKATIDLIERGNYNNQQIIVPSEQLEEVQAHFRAKGSSKTISDHIDAWGAKGKNFTKEDMKKLQLIAQDDGLMPSIDYSHYATKELTLSIGKNAGVMALQTVAITTGLNIASKVFKGEKLDTDEMVEMAIKTGADTSIKVITAGTLQVAIRKGVIRFIPKATPAGVIANIACVGIENVKILSKIASGDVSVIKGIDQMGRVTTSMIGGLIGMTEGAALGAALTGWIPVIGAPLGIVTGFIGGMVGYFGGSKVGDAIYNTGKKVAGVAKNVAKVAVNGLKSAGRALGNGIKSIGKSISNFLRI